MTDNSNDTPTSPPKKETYIDKYANFIDNQKTSDVFTGKTAPVDNDTIATVTGKVNPK